MDDRDQRDSLAARLRRLADRLTTSESLGAGLAPGKLARLESPLTELEALLADEASQAQATAPETGGDAIWRIWSDGSCAPNPGPGGWGVIVERQGQRQEHSGAKPSTTNNVMELTAAIEGLRRTPPGATVHMTTDSRYLKDGITVWLPGWKRNGWLKADRRPVLNRELWEALDRLTRERTVRWEWVPSHAGHPENERCDRLAQQARTRLEKAQREAPG